MDYFKKKAVNASLIKQVLKSPMNAWHGYHNPFQSNDAMNFGSLVHAMVLGVGMEEFVKSPKFDKRKTADKEALEAFNKEHEGKIAINETEWLRAMQCASSVERSIPAKRLIDGSKKEQEFEFLLGDVKCKSKIDGFGDGFIYDLKTTSDLYNFKDVIKEYHYHTQLAFYGYALGFPRVLDYYLIAVNTSEPFECAVFNINSMIQEGRDNINKAIKFADMIVKGEEFGNPREIVIL